MRRAARAPGARSGQAGVWIAGGAVRDAALGRDVVDLDLAVAGDPAVGRQGDRPGGAGHSFELSAEFATWRVVAADHSWQIDVTALRGETIEADLGERDFTIGAVAVPLAGGEPLDPFGGLADLERRLLRERGRAQLRRRPAAPAARRPVCRRPRAGDRPGDGGAGPGGSLRALPSLPASASWSSCASWSAAPTRCAACGCSTSSASPPSSCPSWRRCAGSSRAPTTTSTFMATRWPCSPTRSRSSATCDRFGGERGD